MTFSVALMRKVNEVDPALREVLWSILEEVELHRETSVTKTEFSDLKDIVKELAQAQQRTEQRMKELAQAQQRTEQRMEELAQAQQRTELEIARLAHQIGSVRSQVGGLARSVSYAMENEAYRKLPDFLREHHGLSIEKRMIRTLIDGIEINFFAEARRADEWVLVVGESVLKLDDLGKLKQVLKQVETVRATQTIPVVPLIVTHFAHPKLLAEARLQGVVVVQSYEWG
ncbi:Chordopoxvirus fusion protein [Gammaproteobacteria bacterium]